MKNRKILRLLLTMLLIVFIGTSYSLAHYISKNDLKLETCDTLPYLRFTAKGIIDDEKNNLRQTSVTTSLVKVSENTKFVFKIKYKDKEVRNMVLENHFNNSSILNRKTVADLNEYFKNQGYIVENMNNNEIVFVNNSDRYSYKANRYFLGIYDDVVTIYKTDKNGDITAHKLFNSNVDASESETQKYDFEVQDKGELQYIKIDTLREKDGLADCLIRGWKDSKDSDVSEDMEDSEEYKKGEFKTAKNAFEYAMSLLKS